MRLNIIKEKITRCVWLGSPHCLSAQIRCIKQHVGCLELKRTMRNCAVVMRHYKVALCKHLQTHNK